MSHVFLVRRKFLTIHQACLQYHKHGIYAYKHGMCAHKFLDISGCCTLFSSSTVIRSMYKSITSDYMREFFFLFSFSFSLLVEVVAVVFSCFLFWYFWGVCHYRLFLSHNIRMDFCKTLECQMKSLSKRSTQSWGLD